MKLVKRISEYVTVTGSNETLPLPAVQTVPDQEGTKRLWVGMKLSDVIPQIEPMNAINQV